MSSGIAAFETACWDIVGKALDQPVYNLSADRCAIGQGLRERLVPRRAHTRGVPRRRQESGREVQALKLDPFGPGHYELDEKLRAVALVEAVRDAIGLEPEILLEMHGRFSPATAIEMAKMMEPYGLGWVEEPVPPVNLKALKKASEGIPGGIPVATGERIHQRLEYREVFELQAADVIQPDISHIGGLLETKKLAAWADAYYVTIAPHNVGARSTRPQPSTSRPAPRNFKIQEYFNDFADPWVRDTAPGLPEVVDGYFDLPKGLASASSWTRRS